MDINIFLALVVAVVLLVVWISIIKYHANGEVKRLQMKYEYLDRQIVSLQNEYRLHSIHDNYSQELNSELNKIKNRVEPWYIKLSHRLIDKYNQE